MSNLLDLILANIDKATAIVLAIGALITTAIIQYRKIQKLLAEKEFTEIAAQISAKTESQPLAVLNQIIDKPAHLDSELSKKASALAFTNDNKALIVSQATIETLQKNKPSILKRLGINDAVDGVNLVSSIYQGIVKPILKRS